MGSDVSESRTRERRQRGAGVRSSGDVSEQGRRIDHTPKREAADGPCVASMTSLNLPERMNELSDGVICPFNARRAKKRRSTSGTLARTHLHRRYNSKRRCQNEAQQ